MSVAERHTGAHESAPAPPAERSAWSRRRALGLDGAEWLIFAAFAAQSVLVLAALISKGRPLSGADGLLAADQLQYVTWIREASHHGLVGNLFDMSPGDRAFLHPGFLLSGLLYAAGASLPVAYLALWKPVAIVTAFAGVRQYARRLLPAGGQQRAALILGLFAIMPASWIVAWSGWGGKPRQYSFDFISGEMWTGGFVWGYLMTAIAVGLLPLTLLGVERGRRWLPAIGALLVTWLQPWQGAELLLIIAGVEAIRWRRGLGRPSLRVVAIAAAGTAPAIYYSVLARFDPAWELAGKANAAGAMEQWRWPWWAMALTLLPLAAPAALAYLRPVRAKVFTDGPLDYQQLAVRIWPFAVLAVYLLPFGTFPYHSFQGLAIPLAILAVQGVAQYAPGVRPVLVAAALFLMVVPGLAHKLDVAHHSIVSAGDPFWIFPDEQRAMRALEDDPRPGGTLGPGYAGYMLPAYTGRETWLGAYSWTPDWSKRQELSNNLFEGRLTGEAARRFVTSTNARFLFKDCRPLTELEPTLRPLLQRVRRFGCATIYELKFRPEMARVAGPPDS